MERDAKDRCMTWLAAHHGEALLRAGGVTNSTACVPLNTVLTHPKAIPDGVFRVSIKGRATPLYYVQEVTTYPDNTERYQVVEGIAMVLLEFGLVPDVISLVLAPKGTYTQESGRQLQSATGNTRLTFAFFRYQDLALSEIFIRRPQDMIDTPLIQDLMVRAPEAAANIPFVKNLLQQTSERVERHTRLETQRTAARRAVSDCVKARFGEIPEDVQTTINAITDVDWLWSLVPIAAVESLDNIRAALK